MLPIGNLVNQVFWNTISWDVYNQRFSASIPVDRVTGSNQTQIGYWADSQLWQTIAWSRFAYERNPLVKGVISLLVDHIGKPSVAWLGERRLVEKVQRLWERFATVNCLGESGYLSSSEIAQDREKEIRIRWLRDGEVFLRFFVVDHGFPLRVRFVEPEQIRTPPVSIDEKFSHTWGIVTEKDDNEHIVGYWAFYPQSGEWDFIPRRYMVYGRRNADRNIKRGLPEIANLELDFAHIWSLLRSVAITSKTQASIAWIERFPGALAEQIISSSTTMRGPETNSLGPMLPGKPNPGPSFYGVDPNAKNIDAGTILATNQGKEYEPGPTSDPGKFLEACSTLLHLLSLQWCLPDWVTKGPEAYASALVNGSPFARRIESLQEEYAAIYGQVAMSFLRLMVRSGKLGKEVLRKVRPSVRLPKVIVADEQKQVDLLQKELQAGLLSEIEYLQSRGRNPKKTLAQRRQWKRLLSQFGLSEETGEQAQPTGEASRSDEPHPPGSRILSEEECPKKVFHVFDTKTNRCTTVTRCTTWSPENNERYQTRPECDSASQVSQQAIDEWNKTRNTAKGIWDQIRPKVSEIIAKLRNQDGKVANVIAQEVTTLGALGTKALITLQLTSLLEKSLNENCPLREESRIALVTVAKSLGKLIRGPDFEVEEDDVSMAAQVREIIEAVAQLENDEKLSQLGSALVGELVGNIKQAIETTDKTIDVPGPLLGPHNFAGDKNYFGKILALNAVTDAPDDEDLETRDALIPPLLKRLANRAPYDAAAMGKIDDRAKQFLFDNMVNVGESLYAHIISNIKAVGQADMGTDEGKKVVRAYIETVLAKAPNLYGSTSPSKSKREAVLKEIERLMETDPEKAKQLAIALSQRCLLAYGTADIARRVHEEKWAEYTKGELAANAEFPIVDLTAMQLREDGVTFCPVSLKMHLSSSSDSFAKVAQGIENFVKNKIQEPDWNQNVAETIKERLRQVANLTEPSEIVAQLRRQAQEGYPNECKHSANWNDTKTAQRCFYAEMARMCLLALARGLEDAVGQKNQEQVSALIRVIKEGKVEVGQFSVVRLRGDKIEWKRNFDDTSTQRVPIEGTRDQAIQSAWKGWLTGTGNADQAQGSPAHHHGENSGSSAAR